MLSDYLLKLTIAINVCLKNLNTVMSKRNE